MDEGGEVRFTERLSRIPRLGVGISTEFGAAESGIHPVKLKDLHPETVDFLEIGADLDRGIDKDARAWVSRGWPTTYHFLDVNLEQPEDLDEAWIVGTRDAARSVGAAWLCGDAGIWHIGPRDRGHGTLLPPILCAESAREMAQAVLSLRERTGLEVLPENPPAHVFVGDMHPLTYYAQVAERADCGLLLDLSHLAIAQRALGLRPTALLEEFPIERVVEVHVAGGSLFRSGRLTLIDDDHGPVVQDAVWELLEAIVPRAFALRAVVIECERNPIEAVLPLFARVRRAVLGAPGWHVPPKEPLPIEIESAPPVDHRALQRSLFRMLLDPSYRSADPLLSSLDRDALSADPGRRRALQLLGNAALELSHTVATAPPFLDGFLGSPEMHTAVDEGSPLPIALARYADRVLPAGPSRALLTLEAALAELRRARTDDIRASRLDLAPGVRLISLPEGTLAAAEALARGEEPSLPGSGAEHVVLCASGEPSIHREIRIELLQPALYDLLSLMPASPQDLSSFAARHEATDEDVRGLISELIGDGILAEPR